MPILWDFISDLEGSGIRRGYVPPYGHSGVTIASGVDLGQMNESSLHTIGISDELQDKLRPYLGLKRAQAEHALVINPLILTKDEVSQLDDAIRQSHAEDIKYKYGVKEWDNLSDEAQTVVASVAFQYGTALDRRCPRFWHLVKNGDWAEVVEELKDFGDRYPTRRRKEAALLEQSKEVRGY